MITAAQMPALHYNDNESVFLQSSGNTADVKLQRALAVSETTACCTKTPVFAAEM
jgi:hypothetical protein